MPGPFEPLGNIPAPRGNSGPADPDFEILRYLDSRIIDDDEGEDDVGDDYGGYHP